MMSLKPVDGFKEKAVIESEKYLNRKGEQQEGKVYARIYWKRRITQITESIEDLYPSLIARHVPDYENRQQKTKK